jgi:hypothetical protein
MPKMPKMQDLLESLATIVADYRHGEIAPLNAKYGERWIGQFDNDVRKPMLAELVHVFGQTYFKKHAVETFLRNVLTGK